MWIYNEKDISNGCFTIGDTQYPDNWIENAAPGELAVLGITWVDPPSPSATQIISELTAGLSAFVQSKCAERRYDGPDSFTKYAISNPDPNSPTYAVELKNKNESIAMLAWIRIFWPTAEMIMLEVQQGLRLIPTLPQLLAEMPVAPW
jgi:hypothetical protein